MRKATGVRRSVALLAFLAVACGATAAHAQTLSLAYYSGDTYKYLFHSVTKQTLDMGGVTVPTNVEMTANETVKVKSVDASGAADLAITLGNFVLKTVTGSITNTTTGLPDTTVDVGVAADGRILSLNGNQYSESNPFMAFSGIGGGFFITAILPSGAVRPGDTWSKDYSQANPVGTGAVQVTSHSKYLRDEILKGVNAAVVETTSTGSVDITLDLSKMGSLQSGGASPISGADLSSMTIKGTMTSDVTTWIDPGDHRVLKSHSTESNTGTMTVNITGSNPLPMLSGPMSSQGTGTTDLSPA